MRNLIFDLDGTLVDSRGTIHASLNFTLEQMGRSAIDFERTRGFIGSPLLDIFTSDMGMQADEAKSAIELYRQRYAELGQEGTTVYPRVTETLERLLGDGYRLYIATVKPASVARKVLEAQGLANGFSGISGSSMDSTRKDKAEIIAHALRKNRLQNEVSMMIGDRYHDIEGAQKNNLAPVGVSYGYGSQRELEQAGAEKILGCLSELPGYLMGKSR